MSAINFPTARYFVEAVITESKFGDMKKDRSAIEKKCLNSYFDNSFATPLKRIVEVFFKSLFSFGIYLPFAIAEEVKKISAGPDIVEADRKSILAIRSIYQNLREALNESFGANKSLYVGLFGSNPNVITFYFDYEQKMYECVMKGEGEDQITVEIIEQGTNSPIKVGTYDGNLEALSKRLNPELTVPGEADGDDWLVISSSSSSEEQPPLKAEADSPEVKGFNDKGEFDLASYLEKNNSLNARALNCALEQKITQIQKTAESAKSNSEVEEAKDSIPPDLAKSPVDFGSFKLYGTITGTRAAWEFIDDHKNDKKMVLVPYVANKRVIGEDHVVLLAIKDGKTRIIDPKFGWFLGSAVTDDCIQSLGWQGLMDTENCGFYVYHMIAELIDVQSQKPKGSNILSYLFESVVDLHNHIEGLLKPAPEKIKENVIKLAQSAKIQISNDL